jgi:hypothetical protein
MDTLRSKSGEINEESRLEVIPGQPGLDDTKQAL